MHQSNSVSHHASGDDPEVRSRRLLFRSWHRGTQESDLILGSFAKIHLPDFDSAQLAQFEALLDCTDPELFDWIVGGHAPPVQHDHDVLRLLRNFCTQQTRSSAPNRN